MHKFGGASLADSTAVHHAVTLIQSFRQDPWLERVGPATVLDVEVRQPATRHAVTLQQVERWLAGATPNPTEASKKAKLKMILIARPV